MPTLCPFQPFVILVLVFYGFPPTIRGFWAFVLVHHSFHRRLCFLDLRVGQLCRSYFTFFNCYLIGFALDGLREVCPRFEKPSHGDFPVSGLRFYCFANVHCGSNVFW